MAEFDVLSRIVEIASGQTFNEFVQERIFKPLTARDITFWPTKEQRGRLVTSYIKAPNGLQPRDDPDAMSSQVYFSGAGA